MTSRVEASDKTRKWITRKPPNIGPKHIVPESPHPNHREAEKKGQKIVTKSNENMYSDKLFRVPQVFIVIKI